MCKWIKNGLSMMRTKDNIEVVAVSATLFALLGPIGIIPSLSYHLWCLKQKSDIHDSIQEIVSEFGSEDWLQNNK